MPCYVMLEVTAKPGTAPDMLEALGKLLPDTRGKDGCLCIEVRTDRVQRAHIRHRVHIRVVDLDCVAGTTVEQLNRVAARRFKKVGNDSIVIARARYRVGVGA